jgi:hypothetical protein
MPKGEGVWNDTVHARKVEYDVNPKKWIDKIHKTPSNALFSVRAGCSIPEVCSSCTLFINVKSNLTKR